MKKQLRIGKGKHYIFQLIILIYLINTVYFYVQDRFGHFIFHSISKPLFLYLVDWGIALYFWVAIRNLNKDSTFFWLTINILAVSTLILGFVGNLNFLFYCSVLDVFLLELLSMILLIYTNTRYFKKNYGIKWKGKYWLLIIIIPIIFSLIIYKFLDYYWRFGN